MSFLSYKYIREIEYNKKTKFHSYEYEITDSEWIGVGVGAVHKITVFAAVTVAVIDAYEKHNEPVAPNLALALQYIAKQYGHTIEQIIKLNKRYNPKYTKYEQEVQKYLMLL